MRKLKFEKKKNIIIIIVTLFFFDGPINSLFVHIKCKQIKNYEIVL